ncbi:MAG: alpha-L-fucosidase [Verrucomicrobia bacterium]|nr:alpha-L-fucosidase [Verrucomicrobiota bacterium]
MLIAAAGLSASEVDLTRLTSVVPSPAQLAWQQREIEALVHFGMNTYIGREWGVGREDPRQFNPSSVDAAQWVAAAKSFGAQALILVCKHHDGFCMWPSAFTDHSVKNSPWRNGRGDLVKEVSDACRAGGIGFGVYLSPADLHEPSYGHNSAEYNDFYCSQLDELLTNYGEVCQVFLDGAEPSRYQQNYDWQRYYRLIRELQPKAVISIRGPDVRWVGNESGVARKSEWSVVPLPRVKAEHNWSNMMGEDLGSRSRLSNAPDIHWYPAVADVSLRRNWFWRPDTEDSIKSLPDLLRIYEQSVGRNAGLQLNLSPDQDGRIPEPDIQRLKEFGEALNSLFATDLCEAPDTVSETDSKDGRTSIRVVFAHPTPVRYVVLQEDISRGQRVERAVLTATTADGREISIEVPAIGWKRILRCDYEEIVHLALEITGSRGEPYVSLAAY